MIAPDFLNFNSIKVRLKLPAILPASSPLPFQFHKGTIKTHNALWVHRYKHHFNSIKVRLKPPVRTIASARHRHFNSIKVRLKQPSPTPSGRPASDFNSIKVRLKRPKPTDRSSIAKFQFHKGTIKTDLSHRNLFTSYLFQFHKGTIKTLRPATNRAWTTISIP